MELPKTLLLKKPESKQMKSVQKESVQFNAQDLDQEQRVDVNPSQNVNVYVSHENIDYSAKITGTTFFDDNKIASNVDLFLYWGHENRYPVCKVNSDENGNFIIDELPPGYYTLKAVFVKNNYKAQYVIKAMPCQTAHQAVFLTMF
jgi:hypothetical protein